LKIVSIPDETEFTFPGWPEKVVLAPANPEMVLKIGDRLIFYALEAQSFFAVATITEEAQSRDPKDYFFTMEAESADFYAIDIDAAVEEIDQGVSVDSIELESQPRFHRQRLTAEQFLLLNEDDFELLSETLTELVEEAEEEEEEVLEDELEEEDIDD
jgi:protein involved in polysaccharide export with SLBB domain